MNETDGERNRAWRRDDGFRFRERHRRNVLIDPLLDRARKLRRDAQETLGIGPKHDLAKDGKGGASAGLVLSKG